MADSQDRGGLIYTVENQVSGLDQLRAQRELLQGIRADIEGIKRAGEVRASVRPTTTQDKAALEQARLIRRQERDEIKASVAAYRDARKQMQKADEDRAKASVAAIEQVTLAQRATLHGENQALQQELKDRVKQASETNKAITAAHDDEIKRRSESLRRDIQQRATAAQAEAGKQRQLMQQTEDIARRMIESREALEAHGQQRRASAAIEEAARIREQEQQTFKIMERMIQQQDALRERQRLRETQIAEDQAVAAKAEAAARLRFLETANQSDRLADDKRKADLQTDISRRLGEQVRLEELATKFGERNLKLTQEKVKADQKLTDQLNRRIATAVGRGADLGNLTARDAVANNLASPLPGTPLADEFRKQRPTIGQRITDFLGLTRAQDDADKSSNRLLFTFRRLFGVFAAFAIIRQVNAQFIGLIKSMVTLNASLEQSRLGIASLLLASGNVSDALGNAASGATGLQIASREARRQIELLRQDAIATNTSFQDLVETFQVALSPGLRAGLNVDEIRQFTVRIAQAARAIGLAQNQLAEEIRSILSGTIQARTTRIAVALGITNEDIRNAKAAGTLLPFLKQKFDSFATAGDEAAKTFDGLWNRFTSGIQLAIQSGGIGFFEELKRLLVDINAITLSQRGSIIEINPTAVRFVEEIGKGLSAAVEQARLLMDNLSGGDLVRIGTLIGQSIGVAATAINLLLSGVISGVGDVLVVVNALAKMFALIFGASNTSGFLIFLVRAVTLIKITTTILGLIPGVQRLINLGFARSITLLTVVQGKKLGIIGLLKGILSGSIAVNASFGTWVATISILVVEFLLILAAMDNLQKRSKTLQDVIDKLALSWNQLFSSDALSKQIKDLTSERIDKNKELDRALEQGNKKRAEQLTEEIRLNEELTLQLEARRDAVAATVEQKSALDSVKELISSIDLNGIIPQLPVINTEARTLVEEFGDLPGIIRNSSDAIEDASKKTREFEANLAKAKQELQTTVENLNIAAPVAEMNRAIGDSIINAREQMERFNDRAEELETQRKRAETDLSGLRGLAVPSLSGGDQAKFSVLEKAAKERLKIETSLLKVQQSIRTEEVLLGVAKKTFNDAEIKAHTESLASLKAEEDATKRKLSAEAASFNAILEGADNRQRVIELVKEAILLEGGLKKISEEGDELAKQKNDIEKERIDLLDVELQKIAAIAAAEAQRAIPLVRADAFEAQANLGVGVGANDAVKDNIRLTAEIMRRTETLRLQNQLYTDTNKKMQVMIADMRTQGRSEEEILAIEVSRLNILQAMGLEIEKSAADLKIVEEQQRRAAIKAAEGVSIIGEQVTLSVKEMEEQLPSQFELIDTTLRGIVDGFANFISTSIADAFDPNNDKSIKERFAAFLSDLGKMLLDLVIRIAVVKAVALAFSTGGEVPSAGQAAVGLAKGGKVPDPFAYARGYASGGATFSFRRPAGLHPTDTIPIWAAPGEWIIKAKSAMMYGREALSALNEGLVDPMAFRALANVASGGKAARSAARGPGYARGGSISMPSRSPSPAPVAAGGPVVAIMAPTRETADAIFKGGDAEFLELVERNAAAMNRRLDQAK